MRLLLDECVPRRFRSELGGHDVATVRERGWSGLRNGALIQQASGHFDALITVDQGFEYQQNLEHLPLMVIVLVARGNAMEDLVPLAPTILTELRASALPWLVRIGG
jgi:hypothetical protein